jgi:predicted SAM-dependent methyltransferase
MLPKAARACLRKVWAKLGFNHRTASVLRYEVDMLVLRLGCLVSIPHQLQLKRIRSRTGLKVHLGCGNALLAGWINLDCYPPKPSPDAEILTIDMRRGLPFSDKSVSALFSEHFLEHLPFEVVQASILTEVRRIMEPGGVLRLAVPDGEYFISQYLASKTGKADRLYEENRQSKTAMAVLNEAAHGFGHYFLYDYETLKSVLESAGLVEVRRARAGDSEFEVFRGKDRQDDWRIAMSIYVEAKAPR